VLRLLLTRRWLALLGLVVILVPTFIRLGFWQLDRLDQRRAKNAIISRNIHAASVPVATLTGPERPATKGDEWRPVTASGRYDPTHELLVRNRTATADGQPGFHVLTPLITTGGVVLLVDRGWIPFGETARDTPEAPAPPAGETTVIGRLRPSERQPSRGPRDGAGVPAGQVVRIDVPRIGATLPYSVYGGYVELVSQTPDTKPSPTLLDTPGLSEGPHLAYAVQWYLFATIAVGGFCYLLFREAREGEATHTPATKIPEQAMAGRRPAAR
jgi:cytochrome oxidase assembly protein ShyY1